MPRFKATKEQNRQLKTARQRLTREANRLDNLIKNAKDDRYREDLEQRRHRILEDKEALKVRNASNEKELDNIINKASNTEKVLRSFEENQREVIRADQRKSSGSSSFYSATKDIWKGLDPAERDEAIKAFYNVDTIEEAMKAFEEATGIDLGMEDKRLPEHSSDSIQVLRVRAEIAKELLTRG